MCTLCDFAGHTRTSISRLDVDSGRFYQAAPYLRARVAPRIETRRLISPRKHGNGHRSIDMFVGRAANGLGIVITSYCVCVCVLDCREIHSFLSRFGSFVANREERAYLISLFCDKLTPRKIFHNFIVRDICAIALCNSFRKFSEALVYVDSQTKINSFVYARVRTQQSALHDTRSLLSCLLLERWKLYCQSSRKQSPTFTMSPPVRVKTGGA